MKSKSLLSALVLFLALATGFFAGHAAADQPHMRTALDHLREARAELDRADNDKGGHRARAIQLVNDAIHEVERGMQFDRRH